MQQSIRIDPWAEDAEARLQDALSALKTDAEAIDAENPWLKMSRLTDLGYVRLVLEIGRELTKGGRAAADQTVLDWGGGPGFLSYLLQCLGFRTSYYDIERDFPSYRLVFDRLEGRVAFVDDPTKLPFEDAEFDAVVSFGVLEHVPDPDGSLDELHRVIKPHGKLFVYHFPNRYGYIEAAASRMGRDVHDFKLSREGLESLVGKHGFGVQRFAYRYLLPRNLIDFAKARALVNDHAHAIYRIDAALTKIPAVRTLSTTLNVVCERL